MTLSETELVSRLKKGDLDSFDAIYGIYSGKLYSFGMKYLRSEADAEELVQSVFLKIWENRQKLDKNLSFHSYLFTIAYNEVCKMFRQKKYLKKYVAETLYGSEESSSANEEGTDYRSVLREVNRIIAAMPEKQKKAFLKSKLEGKRSKEVAAELGLSPSTVDNYVSAALKTLKAGIRKENLPLMLYFLLFLI
jgi:RNA polymerase sigma-70 factor (family 1)